MPRNYGRQISSNFAGNFYLVAILSILFIGFSDRSQAQEVKDEAYFFKSGRQAYKEHRYREAEQHFRKADSLRPNHPLIMQYLAMVCGRNGREQCAFHYLNKLGPMNASLSLLQDPAFERFQSTPEFENIRQFYRAMNDTVSRSDTAFTIPEKDLHPEAIAYRGETETFYISSIRKRKVVKRDLNGSFTDLADTSDGLFATSGVAVDEKRDVLWVTSPATRQMERYPDSDSLYGLSYVFKFELSTGKLLQRYAIYDTEDHYFGDLVVHTNGDLYVTDSYYPAIYRIKQGSNWLELFMQFDYLRSLQGITLSEDGKSLWFADYIDGVFKIDLADQKVIQLRPFEKLSLKGIDGLYSYKESLLLIQNGVHPIRITRLYLDESGTKIQHFDFLEKNNPVLDEPTLGTIVNDTFYYVANSPWGKYNSEGNLQETGLENGLIMKIRLKD